MAATNEIFHDRIESSQSNGSVQYEVYRNDALGNTTGTPLRGRFIVTESKTITMSPIALAGIIYNKNALFANMVLSTPNPSGRGLALNGEGDVIRVLPHAKLTITYGTHSFTLNGNDPIDKTKEGVVQKLKDIQSAILKEIEAAIKDKNQDALVKLGFSADEADAIIKNPPKIEPMVSKTAENLGEAVATPHSPADHLASNPYIAGLPASVQALAKRACAGLSLFEFALANHSEKFASTASGAKPPAGQQATLSYS